MTEAARRILLTGANGHLAQRFIRLCADLPDPPAIRAVVRSQRAEKQLRRLPGKPEISIVDYARSDQIRRVMRGCTTVIHLAGILKETRSNRYADAHEQPARAIASAAEEAGVARIVHTSILGADPASGNACLASRGRADAILLGSVAQTLILRVPMVLGPGDVASNALRRQAEAGSVRLVRGGATLEQPIAARDVVTALLNAATLPSLEGGVLDLAGPESLSHRELVMRAARVLGTSVTIKSLPAFVAELAARAAELLLADPPITPAMLGVLEHDDAVDPEPARKALGIDLTPLDESLQLAFGADEGAA